jgi:hypothetical protein
LKRSDPTEFSPGPTDLQAAVTPRRSGHFAYQLHIFVDDGGAREIVLHVNGSAVGSVENDAESVPTLPEKK